MQGECPETRINAEMMPDLNTLRVNPMNTPRVNPTWLHTYEQEGITEGEHIFAFSLFHPTGQRQHPQRAV